jgi:three-Cys-motif partner protein
VKDLNPSGLHFAFLDPYKLDSLPFSIIRKLAELKSMDTLIHVSIQDFQRNLQRYMKQEGGPLDRFAPGWRKFVNRRDTERNPAKPPVQRRTLRRLVASVDRTSKPEHRPLEAKQGQSMPTANLGSVARWNTFIVTAA